MIAVLVLLAGLGVLMVSRFVREATDGLVLRENLAHDAYWAAVRAGS